MSLPIYLDYAATTPVDERVAKRMMQCLTMDGDFGNPASRSHIYGWKAESHVEEARASVAGLLNADIREIVWTSGATESNNLAIKGIAEKYQTGHIITSQIEHKAVLDTCAYLESRGFRVTYIKPDAFGEIHAKDVEAAIEDDTRLISIMHANNEVGTINNIQAIGEVARKHEIPFHVDAAQSAGKLELDTHDLPVDLISLSAHKMYGPKGIGALYVRRSSELGLVEQIHGGGHERGMRSGTLATHQIAGFGVAADIAVAEKESETIATLRDRLWSGIKDIPGISLNGHAEQRLSGHLNLCFSGVDGETLLLSLKDLAISSGSACMSASMAPSYVLKAMGLTDSDADSSVRISLGRFTSEADIEKAIEHIHQVYTRLKEAV